MVEEFPTNVSRAIGRHAWQARYLAAKQAAARGGGSIQVAHLLLGLLEQQDAVVMKLLSRGGVDIPALTHDIEALVGPATLDPSTDCAEDQDWAALRELTVEQRLSSARFALTLMEIQGRHRPPVPLPNSDGVNDVAILAMEVTERVRSDFIEAEHLLIAIALIPGDAASGLKNRGFDPEVAIGLLNNPDSAFRRPPAPLWQRSELLSGVRERADEYAAANHRTGVTREDLLSALATVPSMATARLFKRAGVDRQLLIDRLGSVKPLDEQALSARWSALHLSEDSKALLLRADQEAQRRGHSELGFEDLFLAVLASGKGAAFEALTEQGLDLDTCRRLFEETASAAGTE
ncbi:MAG TPA: Clp protease N-terminal domain-containing protein [Armatimonadota bacterium]|nr:Clp protease N-terminal domain-containing protein [Armatimonadota bacterium]